MIHDILLSCLNLHTKQLPIAEFRSSDAVSVFLHPSEKKILQDIINIINLLRKSAKFAKMYGSHDMIPSLVDTDEPLQNGVYLKAFANGIDTALEIYYDDMLDLERRYLQNPTQSLLFIYQQLYMYEPMALFLCKAIRDIRQNKLHGCAILQYLHHNAQHGDQHIAKAMQIIQERVNLEFQRQLMHWLLHAKIMDQHGEFFIQCSEMRNNSTFESDRGAATSTTDSCGRQTATLASTFADIWHYEICHQFLPHYLTATWAEKVLFIGQTVLIFKVDPNKSAELWHKCDSNQPLGDVATSLWNDREYYFFDKIQALQNDANTNNYERVIDEIKTFVTTRLSEVAVKQADLVQQLHLIKNYFLLGRGELYHEFIRLAHTISGNVNNENKLRDFVKAFESAAHSVGVSDDLEQFSLCIPKTLATTELTDDSTEFGLLQSIQLHYNINWPLHLLFSPRALKRYNVLFRFLLLAKRLQYDLHSIWCTQTAAAKRHATQHMQVLHLRNQLMFFVDNLQYYIQVDVLESQFNILLTTILNKADFEQIQRAHSVFQANVLGLCFLLTDEDATKLSMSQSHISHSNNPVYLIINGIFHLCDDFCKLLDDDDKVSDEMECDIARLNARFGDFMEQLINLLVVHLKTVNTTPLSQLLLRLDFNNWFSRR